MNERASPQAGRYATAPSALRVATVATGLGIILDAVEKRLANQP